MNALAGRKLQIFISATRHDLAKAREKLILAILDAGHIPSGMELWTTAAKPVQSDIRRHMDGCDAHIVLVGTCYGELVDGGQVSYTEWEFDQSENKRPILAFVSSDDHFHAERGKIKRKYASERKCDEKLLKFRKRVRHNGISRSFENTPEGVADLCRLCVDAIHEMTRLEDFPEDAGWMRASDPDATKVREINANPFLREQLNQLRKFTVVSQRMVDARVAKETQASEFWLRLVGPMRRHKYHNLFFESGSTLAYVSGAFVKQVLRPAADDERWRVWTNNVFTLLQLLLETNVEVNRFPNAPPDPTDKYGAFFPPDWSQYYEAQPLDPRVLFEGERGAVERMRKDIPRLFKHSMLLMTSSGWDLDHRQVHFRGPHVGSHPNMLFKRALLTSGQPAVIFLNADKLGEPFVLGNCYPVFGPDRPLDRALAENPIAFCVGYDRTSAPLENSHLDETLSKRRNDPQWVLDALGKLGFVHPYTPPGNEKVGAVFVANGKFLSMVPPGDKRPIDGTGPE